MILIGACFVTSVVYLYLRWAQFELKKNDIYWFHFNFTDGLFHKTNPNLDKCFYFWHKKKVKKWYVDCRFSYIIDDTFCCVITSFEVVKTSAFTVALHFTILKVKYFQLLLMYKFLLKIIFDSFEFDKIFMLYLILEWFN